MTDFIFDAIQACAPVAYCPKCDGCCIIRSDTGLCERCTAKLPEQIAAWEDWRWRCQRRAKGFKLEDAAIGCLTCGQPYGPGVSEFRHKQVCRMRPLACPHCPRRFDRGHDLRLHQSRAHEAA